MVAYYALHTFFDCWRARQIEDGITENMYRPAGVYLQIQIINYLNISNTCTQVIKIFDCIFRIKSAL